MRLAIKETSTIISWLFFIGLSGQLVSSSPSFAEHSALVEDHHWERPHNAIRGPCPVMNTLANHGYIPRSGQNITIAQMRKGLTDSINLHPLPRDVLVYLIFNKVGEFTNSGFVVRSLRDLKYHNFIEHDFSLSRQDKYFGDPVNPSPELLRQLEQASGEEDTYTLEDFAKFSNQRIKHSLEHNPNVTYTPRLKAISQMEMGLFVDVFGKDHKISKQAVMDVFAHERLPKGFQRAETTFFLPGMVNLLELAIRSKLLNPEI